MSKIIRGRWFDADGFRADLNIPALSGAVVGSTFVDDDRATWTVNNDGDLISDDCVMTFSPDAGELDRVGLA